MKPHALLDLANELLDGADEVHWRTAVNRAYFAAFHVARQLLTGCGFIVSQGDQAHTYLWLRLSNAGHPDVMAAGRKLRDLRRARNEADYDISLDLPHATAAAFVLSAFTLVELLELVDQTPGVQSQIIAAIRTYERNVLRQATWQP